MTGTDDPDSRDTPQIKLDAATTARIRAEEIERLRVRAELENEQRRILRNENKGCFGAINLLLKIMGW